MTSIKPTKAQQARAVSASEAARLLGRDRGTVSRWIEDGCPTVGSASRGEGVEWRLDLGAVVAWLLAREREAERERVEAKLAPEIERLRRALEQASGGNGEPVSRSEALRRRTLAEARLKELEAAEREGALVDRGQRDAEWVNAVTIQKAHLLSIAAKTALDLAASSEPRQCHGIVARAIHEAMETLADWGEGGGFAWADPPPGALARLLAVDLGIEVVAQPLEAGGK